MRVGRLREQISAYNWFGVVIELAIVVVGVLIAIQVANWNQDRLDHERGRAYYQRIEDDLRLQITDLRAREAYYAQVRRYGERALADFDRPTAQLDEQFLIALIQASQILVGPFAHTNYEEAVQSGDFREVGDSALRTQIATHFDLTLPGISEGHDRPPYRDRIRRALPYQLQNAIVERCGDRAAYADGGLPITVLPANCTAGLNPAQTRLAIRTVLALPELKQDLTRYLLDLKERVSLIVFARQEAEGLLANMQRNSR